MRMKCAMVAFVEDGAPSQQRIAGPSDNFQHHDWYTTTGTAGSSASVSHSSIFIAGGLSLAPPRPQDGGHGGDVGLGGGGSGVRVQRTAEGDCTPQPAGCEARRRAVGRALGLSRYKNIIDLFAAPPACRVPRRDDLLHITSYMGDARAR